MKRIVLLVALLFAMPRELPAAKAKGPSKSTLAYQYYARGVEFASGKKWDDALAKFGDAIDLNPGYTAAYIEYARTAVLLGRRKDGLQKLSTALQSVRRMEDREKILKERDNLAEIFYTNETFQQYQHGLNYLKLDRAGSAVEALEKAIKTEPDNVLVLSAYARALQAEERAKEALDVLEKAFALNDGTKGVRLDLAEMVLPKQPERSLALLKPLASKAPDERVALLQARTLSALHRNKDAIEYLRDRAEKQQSWIMAQLWLGKLYSLEPNGNWNARKHLMTFLKRTTAFQDESDPEQRQYRLARGEAEALLMRVNKALE